MKFTCAQCGETADRPSGHVNRARARGLNLYCSRVCSGLGRRSHKTVEQRKAEKKAYDAEYRLRDIEALRARKAEYHQRTYDPVKAAEVRKERMPQHIEYCRRQEYRQWKKSYDRKYRAEKFYGDLADCFLLVMDIRDECLIRMTDYEIRVENGTINKSLRRKRDDQRSYSHSPEEGPLGNLERGQGWQNGGLSSGRYRLSGSRNSAHDEHTVEDRSAVQAPGIG